MTICGRKGRQPFNYLHLSALFVVILTFSFSSYSPANATTTKQFDNSNNENAIIRNPNPVIGILAHGSKKTKYDHIIASYVKWLELGGARAIPIPYDASNDLVDEIFDQINGVVFPGGSVPLPPSAKRLWQLAVRANYERGEFFPMWGTCLGFQFLFMLASAHGTHALQHGFQAVNVSIPLLFTDSPTKEASNPGSYNGLLYKDPRIRSLLSNQNITYNHHVYGVEPEHFQRDSGITNYFQITTTNIDDNGRPFVSTLEPVHPEIFPVYGVQYHPEVVPFEYDTFPNTNIPYRDVDHSNNAIDMSFALARFFVGLARENLRRNYPKRHCYTMPQRHPWVYHYYSRQWSTVEQMFFIPKASHWKPKALPSKAKSSVWMDLYQSVTSTMIGSFGLAEGVDDDIDVMSLNMEQEEEDIMFNGGVGVMEEYSLPDETNILKDARRMSVPPYLQLF